MSDPVVGELLPSECSGAERSALAIANRGHVQAVVAVMYDDGVGTAPGRDPPRGTLGLSGVRVHARGSRSPAACTDHPPA